MTTDRIDTSPEAIAALLDGVTPGPWVEFISDDGGKWSGWPVSIECTSIVDKTIIRPGGHWPYEWDAKTSCNEACANARFIAAARDLVPALAEERDRLRAQLEVANAMVAAAYNAAAECCDEYYYIAPTEMEAEILDDQLEHTSNCIRSLTPHDAAAALEARDRRMRNEGRRQAAQIALDWFYDPERDTVTDNRLPEEILASLEPEDM